jgi:hypothetical protein
MFLVHALATSTPTGLVVLFAKGRSTLQFGFHYFRRSHSLVFMVATHSFGEISASSTSR